jgi:cytochrome c biogenesis protein CcdA
MLHEPVATSGADHAADYKMRLGVWMFLFYSGIYAVFVVINVVRPAMMEITILFGMNLAAVFGIGLIVFALLQALIYDKMCRRQEALLNRETAGSAR